jgi:hypothetical protein
MLILGTTATERRCPSQGSLAYDATTSTDAASFFKAAAKQRSDHLGEKHSDIRLVSIEYNQGKRAGQPADQSFGK